MIRSFSPMCKRISAKSSWMVQVQRKFKDSTKSRFSVAKLPTYIKAND